MLHFPYESTPSAVEDHFYEWGTAFREYIARGMILAETGTGFNSH